MLRLVRTTAGLLLALAAITSVAHAAGSWWSPGDWGPTSYSVDSDSYGKYIWRGWTLDDQTVYQPTFELGYQPFKLTVCATYCAQTTHNWSDVTYAFTYTNSTPKFDWTVGHIWYVTNNKYNQAADPAALSTEFCFSCTAKALPLYPTLSYFHDYDQGNGDYAQLTLTKYIPVGKKSLPWTLQTSFGYNVHQYRSVTGFSDWATSLEIPIKLGKQGPVIIPTLSYSKSLDNRFFADQFYAGIRMPWGG